MEQEEMHQLMLERLQRCEEALAKAKEGQATEEDWEVIRFECGLKKEKQDGLNR